MKNIIKHFTCLGAAALIGGMAISCSDTLEEKFYDPDKVTEAKYDLLFTKAITRSHLFRLEYGPVWWHYPYYNRLLGISVLPSEVEISQNTDVRVFTTIPRNWGDVIFQKATVDHSIDIKSMQLLYADMTPEEQAENAIYAYCAEIIQSYVFQRCTDLYDDVPYFEASGALQESFFPAYDSQEEIYDDILNRLETVVKNLDNYQFPTSSGTLKAKFTAADALNGGDITQWIRFANSLRLRMAMRLCHVKPDKAKEVIREVLADGRIVDEYAYNIGFEEQNKILAPQNSFIRGFDERAAYSHAPAHMYEEMMFYTCPPGMPENVTEKIGAIERYDYDPRIHCIFQPDRYGRYIGIPLSIENSEEYLAQYYHNTPDNAQVDSILFRQDLFGDNRSTNRITSMYNRTTFMNVDLKFPVMHATEVNMLLAEAALRWPGEFGSINVEECIKKGIESSVRWYYNVNQNMKYGPSTTPAVEYLKETGTAPALNEAHLAYFLDFAVGKYNEADTKGKLKFLLNQKMLDMNVFNPWELWNETRRLVKDFDGQLPHLPAPHIEWVERFYYPDDESINNAENFEKVAHKNTMFTPVWWTGRTEAAKSTNGPALR